MNRWRIAIVGAGGMAHEHARAFASLPGVQVVGFCGRTRARVEALAQSHGVVAFDSIAAMQARTGAHAVVVAVNELSMERVCRECFALPWHCLLEKPVGIDLPQAEALLAAAVAQNVRAYVALNRRAYASTRQAQAELAADNGPRLISVLDQQDMDAARAGGQPPLVVQNYMYANSIHLIDTLRHFGRGEVTAVEPIVPWNPARPGFVSAVVRFSSGDTGLYQAVWDGPGPWAVAITNRQVRLELRPMEHLNIQRRGERRMTPVVPDPIDTEFKPGLRFQAEQFVAAMEGRTHRLASLADATRSMALCAAIYGHRTAVAA